MHIFSKRRYVANTIDNRIDPITEAKLYPPNHHDSRSNHVTLFSYIWAEATWLSARDPGPFMIPANGMRE